LYEKCTGKMLMKLLRWDDIPKLSKNASLKFSTSDDFKNTCGCGCGAIDIA
jgi:hypothetical protein